ncbi:hypothetical protein A2U01_0035924, partial [Trifolium medium]|nr:hypothetical protein [Trifolium medium]
IGAVAYKLQLPVEARIHPVFHVSQLKPYIGTASTPYMPLPLTTTALGPILQPEAILDNRTVVQGSEASHHVLVKWCNVDEAHATWEDTLQFAEEYPTFNLEDKVSVNGGSIVRTSLDNTGPHHAANKENEGIKSVMHVPHNQEGRGQRNKFVSTRLRDYIRK